MLGGLRTRLTALALATVAACAPGGPPTESVVSASATPGVGPPINAARAQFGLSQLAQSRALTDAAIAQARYAAARGELTHRSAGNATVKDRVEARGYDACLAAENLAARQRSEAEVAAGWLSSPGHRSNIMLRQATHWGAGKAVTAEGETYWVLVLAGRC